LASVALPKYVEYTEEGKPYFNHELLFSVAKDIVLPMNNVIDYNYYPTPETELSNFKHRPIGVGVQGLADTYIKMGYPFESMEARKLNKEIFETLYYGTLTGSMELSKKQGAYSTFEGSPFSEGKFQFDLWKDADNIDLKDFITGRWDWETLRKDIKEHGVRNSTLLTCMPTASSAQIMGNSDTMEPIDSCIYKKRVLSGEYIIANKYLVRELTKLGLWSKEMKDTIIAHNGSIQKIEIIPDDIKALYKTVWEMSMKNIIEQSHERSPYIDMTQSLNLFMQSPNYKKLTSMHFYAWNKRLKTGMYYLRQTTTVTAGKFSVDPELEKKLREMSVKEHTDKQLQQQQEDDGGCEMCSA
jgi:ribonucleoside-diphosphate reductase alpha chain